MDSWAELIPRKKSSALNKTALTVDYISYTSTAQGWPFDRFKYRFACITWFSCSWQPPPATRALCTMVEASVFVPYKDPYPMQCANNTKAIAAIHTPPPVSVYTTRAHKVTLYVPIPNTTPELSTAAHSPVVDRLLFSTPPELSLASTMLLSVRHSFRPVCVHRQ